MATALPESYRRLGQYAARYAAGTTIYEQGAVPTACYIVAQGEVEFEVVDAEGVTAPAAVARQGDLVGYVAAFTGRPTSATARARAGTILLAIPILELVDAFRDAPELALQLIRAFADPQALRDGGEGTPPPWGAAPAAEDTSTDGAPSDAAPSAASPARPAAEGVVPVTAEYDAAFFFIDTADCPVSGTRFEYLRVRTSAVRPVSRDSDFRVVYRSLDPTHYTIIACPACGYAAYREDFDELSEEERVALRAATEERAPLAGGGYAGHRSTEDAEGVVRLALACYALRRTNERRRAALLHRLAWIERERGNEDEEQLLLLHARDAYRSAFEGDTTISAEGALRAAYLIGDLTLRLGDALEAARWFEIATRSPEAKSQSGLVRMARERLFDAHTALSGPASKRTA